jgi:hypothetical protein
MPNTFGPPLDPPEGVECSKCHNWEEDCICDEPDPDTMPGGHDWKKDLEAMEFYEMED